MRRTVSVVPMVIVAVATTALLPTAAEATPTGVQKTRSVRLDATRIGTVRLGGAPADTVTRLTKILGKPDKAGPVEGCRLASQPAGYEARWGALTVYGQGETTRSVEMGSWTLTKGRTPVKLTVSRGLRPGMTVSQIKATGAPTTRLENDWAGWTMRASGLQLFLTDRAPHRIETITANPYWCE